MVERYVEESLDLRRMQIHRNDPVRPGMRNKIRDEFSRYGNPRLVFSVLPSVAEIRNHCRHAPCGCPLRCVQHDQQLHQIVRRRIRRLDDEDIAPANVLIILYPDFPIAKVFYLTLTQWLTKPLSNVTSELGIGSSGKKF